MKKVRKAIFGVSKTSKRVSTKPSGQRSLLGGSLFVPNHECYIDVPQHAVARVTDKLRDVELKSATNIELHHQAGDVYVFHIIGPAENQAKAKTLIKELVGCDRWELDPDLLTIGDVISKGPFGSIYSGNYRGIGPVAVKELNPVDFSSRKTFFDMTTVWKTIEHPRFVKLYGMCTFRPWYVIAELMDKGKLLSCLQGAHKLNLVQMVRIATHICEGMKYLESKKMVQLHLSSVNILVSGDWNVKLYAAWLCAETTDGFYIGDNHYGLPYSWWSVAAEVYREGRMSIKSNVWSFGIILSDIMTYGKSPFRGQGRSRTDYKMPKPDHIPQEFYDIMVDCLKKDPNRRPTFAQLYDRLTQMELNHDNYDLAVDVAIYNQAYHRALEHGFAANRRIPIMIVGQDRSGKTSLKKHLQGLPFDTDEPSTCGIQVDIVELTEVTAKQPWKKKELSQFIMSEDEVNERVLKQAVQLVTQQESFPDASQETTDALEVELEATQQEPVVVQSGQEPAEQVEADPIPESLSKEMINDIKLLEDNMDEIAASPPITAFLHDLAGQNVYYDTHYYFLKLQCPYVVVHDLRIPFDSLAQPRFKPKLKAERNLENPFLASNLDYFLSWFTVLSRLQEATSVRSGAQFPTFTLPPVLIALTNSDRFEGDLEEVKSRIMEILNKRGFDNVFITPYVVDNSSSGSSEDEIANLRFKLYELCSEILGKQRPVPIRWLKFEANLSNLMVSKKLSYIPLAEACQIADACKVDDVDAAIRFLHHQGVLVHHSGSSVVVLNPAWLMNRFADIITIPQEDKPCNALYRQLMTEGILLQEYLYTQEDGKVLEELMRQFGLICPWEHEGRPAYIVPSVSPLMEKGQSIEEKLRSSPIASLFLRFNRGYMLPGVFTRFVVQAIVKCANHLRIEKPRLFCNYTLLSFQWSGQKFDVYLIQQLAAIKVGVLPRGSFDHAGIVPFACYLKNVVSECIQAIKEDEGLFYCNIDVTFTVKCSVCIGETGPCLRHAKEGCASDDCGHFWAIENLLELLEDPVCDFASVAGTLEFPLKPVRPWMGLDGEETEVDLVGEPVISDLDVLKRRKICRLLDVLRFCGDFRELAGHFGIPHDELMLIAQKREPTDEVLNWASTKPCNTLEKLRQIFLEMGRDDCNEIIEQFFQSR